MKNKNPIYDFDFAELLVKQAPVFDEAIMRDVRMDDGWIIPLPFPWKKMYVETLNAVRSLSEGTAFKKVSMSQVRFPKIKQISPMGTSTEIIQDRFNHVWPNITETWKRH